MNNSNPESQWFGTESVAPDEKTRKVLGVFDSVASKYDVMNDAMSLGIHRIWKDKFIEEIAPRPGQACLDVAGGTGDIAFRLHARTQGKSPITVSDINASMLEVGQDRAIDRGITSGLDFVTANAEKLPFPDNSFDIYTIAFGLRNVTHIDDALREACRVLKPGGRFWCLEFSQVKNPLLSKGYDLYSQHLIPHMGQLIAQDKESYKYLVESIRKHPNQENLRDRIKQAGFNNAWFKNMSFGVVAIHTGQKPKSA
tara:strand:+ start:180 stop:944 length:765 start_codon:yes stop_codon:yes gene_type:complete